MPVPSPELVQGVLEQRVVVRPQLVGLLNSGTRCEGRSLPRPAKNVRTGGEHPDGNHQARRAVLDDQPLFCVAHHASVDLAASFFLPRWPYVEMALITPGTISDLTCCTLSFFRDRW
jgi:hypothetical protein